MARLAYDFLSESFLFDQEHVADRYARFSDDDMSQELERYREHIRRVRDDLTQELVAREKGLSVYLDSSSRHDGVVELLKQCSLYYNEAIVDDPLFSAALVPDEMSGTMSRYFGFRPHNVDRQNIAKIAATMRELTPMVAAGFLKYIPISAMHERARGQVPLCLSPNGFAEALPEPLWHWFHSKAEVFPMMKLEGADGWSVRFDDKLSACRAICVELCREHSEWTRLYHLMEQEVVSTEEREDGRRFATFRQWLPDTPPSDDLFLAWVFQCVNRTALDMLQHLTTDLFYMNSFNSMLLTQCPLVNELLQVQLGAANSVAADIGTLALQLNLPILQRVSVVDLMRVRTNEGAALERFRIALSRHLTELRHLSDPDELRARLRDVEHELTDIQIREVESESARGWRKVATDALLGGVAMGAMIPIGWPATLFSQLLLEFAGTGLFGAIQGAVRGAPQHPAYFLWRLHRTASR